MTFRTAGLRLTLGATVSIAAFAVAWRLSSGEAREVATATPLLIGGAFLSGFALHLLAHLLADTLSNAATSLERRLASATLRDGLPLNEDVLRAGRCAALRGVSIAAQRYAQADVWEHEPDEAERFAMEVKRWVKAEIAVASRLDRVIGSSWTSAGLSFLGVRYGPDLASHVIEQAAWAEFSRAMRHRGTPPPETFRAYFNGGVGFGLGWRAAGHLVFMQELKRNNDVFVGFVAEALNRIERALSDAPSAGKGPRAQSPSEVWWPFRNERARAYSGAPTVLFPEDGE